MSTEGQESVEQGAGNLFRLDTVQLLNDKSDVFKSALSKAHQHLLARGGNAEGALVSVQITCDERVGVSDPFVFDTMEGALTLLGAAVSQALQECVDRGADPAYDYAQVTIQFSAAGKAGVSGMVEFGPESYEAEEPTEEESATQASGESGETSVAQAASGTSAVESSLDTPLADESTAEVAAVPASGADVSGGAGDAGASVDESGTVTEVSAEAGDATDELMVAQDVPTVSSGDPSVDAIEQPSSEVASVDESTAEVAALSVSEANDAGVAATESSAESVQSDDTGTSEVSVTTDPSMLAAAAAPDAARVAETG